MSALHRFVRNPNYLAGPYNRTGNRSNPLKNTLVKLFDPKMDRTIYLIGTTNSNSMLAYRTQQLINDLKPDTVFVQCNKKFADLAKQIDVKSQKEMNEYNNYIMKTNELNFDDNLRSIGFMFRFSSWLFVANLLKFFPKDFHPFIPGLEMKFAIEAAEKIKSKIIFGGQELDQSSFDALKLQYSINPFSLFWKATKGVQGEFWETERKDIYDTLSVQGGETFAESIDQSRINWFVKYFQKLMPEQKKIFIDQKDEDLFVQIYNQTGKNVVAVVNQWHLEGIEAHWRHSTSTEKQLNPINPIGDFDIEKLMENRLINDKLREITSKICNSEPATHQDVITHYHKEVQEFERTRHVHFEDAHDHHMYHGLPEDSNDAPLQPLKEINQQETLKIDSKKH